MSNNNALLLLEQSNKEGAIITYDEKGLAVNVRKGKKISPGLMQKLKAGKRLLISHFEQKQVQKDRLQSADFSEIDRKRYYVVGTRQDYWMYQNTTDKTAGKLTYEFGVSGKLGLTAFQQAVAHLFDRHESLRASFHRKGETNLMRVEQTNKNSMQYYDIRHSDDQLSLLEEHRNFKDLEFDLQEGPLCIVRLIQTEDEKYTFCLMAHHIIFDKLSKEIFLRELLTLYHQIRSGAKPGLPELPFQFKEHLCSEQKFIARNKEAHKKFWTERFPALPNEFISPIKPIVNGNRSNSSQYVSFPMQKELLGKVNTYARDLNTTASIVLQAAFHSTRIKITGQEDTIVGSAIFGRHHSGFENQIGYFAEVVLIRTQINSGDSFSKVVQKVKEANEYNDDFAAVSLMDHTWEFIKEEKRSMTGHYWKVNIRFVDERANSVAKVHVHDLMFEQVKAKQGNHISLDFDWHFIVDNKNNLSVMVRYDEGLYDQNGIEDFTKQIEEALYAI